MMIKLSSGKLRITGKKRKTQAELYKDVQIGDELLFTMGMDGIWNYASNVRIQNLTQGTFTTKTLAKAAIVTDCFDLEPVL